MNKYENEKLQLALDHLRQRRFAEAEVGLRRVLQGNPNHPVALRQLGLLAQQFGRMDVALELLGRAVRVSPNDAGVRASFAGALAAGGRGEEAVAQLRAAVELEPGSIEWLGRLAIVLTSLGRFAESREVYLRAEPLATNLPDALAGAAAALGQMDFLDDALRFCRRALELNSSHPRALNNLGVAYAALGEVEKAVPALRASARAGNRVAEHNLLFNLHFHPGYDIAAIHEEHRAWAAAHADALEQPFARRGAGDRDAERRLRIGYVSPDFRDHPIGRLIEPILASHDRERFEVVCYSGVARPDPLTMLMRSYASLWRDVRAMDDVQLAQQIRDDRVDVLIDLSLHMADNRMLVFARRAAPVQVTWLGYPSTSGLRTMDYRLTDPHIDPPALETERHYTERTIRLPHSFWPYRAMQRGPVVNALPARAVAAGSAAAGGGGVTFAALNNPLKFNPAVYDAFARVLTHVPGSRLMLLNNGSAAAARRVTGLLVERGVAGERVTFVDRAPLDTYLAYHHRADIVLDPFPYPGHTTTLDALWMGVPVVTLTGDADRNATAVSRGGECILTNVGLGELIARDVDGYVRIAVELAEDLDRLAALRATLRDRLRSSPICDVQAYTRDVEQAYRAMWREWCAGE